MIDGAKLSKYIRDKKKKSGQADLRQDMDYAGQEGVDPNDAWDEKQAMEVNEAMDSEPEGSASEAEMGEHESSQDKDHLKRAMARINSYMDELFSK
jgi:hypothetical protein